MNYSKILITYSSVPNSVHKPLLAEGFTVASHITNNQSTTTVEIVDPGASVEAVHDNQGWIQV